MTKLRPKHKCKIENGKLIIEDWILKPYKDGVYAISIKPFGEKEARSNSQNAYYWGVIVNILSDETGYTSDEIHELLKFKFLKSNISIKGKEYITTKSTTELTTIAAEEFFSNIRQWASIELGIYIPLPNEVEY